MLYDMHITVFLVYKGKFGYMYPSGIPYIIQNSISLHILIPPLSSSLCTYTRTMESQENAETEENKKPQVYESEKGFLEHVEDTEDSPIEEVRAIVPK